jgi:Leucine-rich repeat (LRR) protein
MFWSLFPNFEVKGSSVSWEEVEALRSLYVSTNGSKWTWKDQSTNGLAWNFANQNNSQIDPCNTNNSVWQGISCSEKPSFCNNSHVCYVISLNLQAHTLRGPLPKSIEMLARLQYLNFYYNKLTGTISGINFSKLANLTYLDLRYNSIRGQLPNMSSVNNWAHLDFSTNAFTGPFYSSYCELSSLTFLSLSNARMTDTIPSCIVNLTNLQTFTIDQNSFSGYIPSSLGLMTALTELRLRGNFFSGPVLPFLTGLPYLFTFDVGSNHFTGPLPENIGNIGLSSSGSALEYWYINYNLFTGTLPSSLGLMTQLWKIVANNNFLHGPLPSVLGALPLQFIFLHENDLTGHIPAEICRLQFINNFRVEHNSIDGAIPSCIGNMSTLVRIQFTDNLLTGQIPHSIYNLTKLQLLYLDDNLLSGSITNGVSNLQKMLFMYISNNYIYGEIPQKLGLMKSLFFMNFSTNLLTSSIPSSVSCLQALQNFEVRANLLTGSLPQAFEALGDSIIYLFLNDNFIDGKIDHINWTKFPNLVNFDVSRNEFTGTLPSYISSTSALFYLRADANHFEQSLPASLGDYTALLELTLSENKFTGTIPHTLGQLTSLRVLALHHNKLKGQVPSSFRHLTSLAVMQLHSNRLTDCFGDMYWQAPSMVLTNVDMSDNLCHGALSSDMFKIPTLETVALSVNCFSGSLPDNICLAGNLSVISMDGLAAASECAGRFNMPFSEVDVPLSRGVVGTIPKCMISLPNLIVLHLAANHFTGTLSIAKSEVSPHLLNLSLAYNQLSGTISAGIKDTSFVELDLGYNKFTGNCDNFAEPPHNNSLFSLKVNRLSGVIPHAFSTAGHVDVLEGNLFSCSSGLPVKDPNHNSYTCGSSELDQANYVFVSILGMSSLFGTVYLISRMRKIYSRKDPNTTVPDETGGDVSTPDNNEVLSQHVFGHSVMSLATEASKSLYIYTYFLDYLTPTSLHNVRSFRAMMWTLSKSVVCICMLGTLLLMPLYVLKLSEEGSGSYVYSTHETTHAWVSTVAYISGVVPAAIIMTAWIVLVTVIVWNISPMLLHRDKRVNRASDSDFDIDTDTDTDTASGTMRAASANTVGTNHSKRLLYLQIALAMSFNAVVVLAVNGAYVYSTLIHLSPQIHLVVQLTFAMFKLVWNFFLVPGIITCEGTLRFIITDLIAVYLFAMCLVCAWCLRAAIIQSMPTAPSTRAKLKLYSSMFNSIIAPCLSALFTSPLCYKVIYFVFQCTLCLSLLLVCSLPFLTSKCFYCSYNVTGTICSSGSIRIVLYVSTMHSFLVGSAR